MTQNPILFVSQMVVYTLWLREATPEEVAALHKTAEVESPRPPVAIVSKMHFLFSSQLHE